MVLALSRVAFLCAALAAAAPAEFRGRVVGVSDGDTITVLVDRAPVRIRLWGIDAPERRQPHGRRARQFTASLAMGQAVAVRVKDRDRYGRQVAVVVLADGRELNREIVRAGYAWWARRYAPEDLELERAESAARRRRAGLWRDPNPIPPWQFRTPRTEQSR